MQRNNIDKLIVLGGGTLLGLLIILSWVPRSCPIVRRAIATCPTTPLVQQTPAQQEENRIPHQTITNNSVEVEVKSAPDRSQTRVDFLYRLPSGSTAVLSIDGPGGKVPLATIANPIVQGLLWNRISNTLPDASLYTLNPITVDTIPAFLATKPKDLTADAAAAQLFQLSAGSYTPLESLTTIGTHTAVLTTYLPPTPDGTWSQFEESFDLSSYTPNNGNELQFLISLNRSDPSVPFLLGEVHVDYQK